MLLGLLSGWPSASPSCAKPPLLRLFTYHECHSAPPSHSTHPLRYSWLYSATSVFLYVMMWNLAFLLYNSEELGFEFYLQSCPTWWEFRVLFILLLWSSHIRTVWNISNSFIHRSQNIRLSLTLKVRFSTCQNFRLTEKRKGVTKVRMCDNKGNIATYPMLHILQEVDVTVRW